MSALCDVPEGTIKVLSPLIDRCVICLAVRKLGKETAQCEIASFSSVTEKKQKNFDNDQHTMYCHSKAAFEKESSKRNFVETNFYIKKKKKAYLGINAAMHS